MYNERLEERIATSTYVYGRVGYVCRRCLDHLLADEETSIHETIGNVYLTVQKYGTFKITYGSVVRNKRNCGSCIYMNVFSPQVVLPYINIYKYRIV